jgi:hypothetical protein
MSRGEITSSTTEISMNCTGSSTDQRASDRRGAMRMSDDLVGRYRVLQQDLAQHGVTWFTLDPQYELERALAAQREISLLDPEQLDAALDRLHIQAFPDPKRPPRLVCGDLIDPRE